MVMTTIETTLFVVLKMILVTTMMMATPTVNVTDHAVGHGDVVVLAELDEEVQHVEGGGGGEGVHALEALVGHLVAKHPHVQGPLQLVQLVGLLQQHRAGVEDENNCRSPV